MQHALVTRARVGVRPADSAARAGYADQSHLARDVKEMAGVPLGEHSSAERGEQLDVIAVGVEHDRVALAPERIPRFEVAVAPGCDERRVGRVDVGRVVARERQ